MQSGLHNSRPSAILCPWQACRALPGGEADLLIEGDNLEALKILAADYENRVDFIYIDPPYNSGKNFLYRNDFSKKGRENGSGAFSGDARRHGPWLSMIYPRLVAARRLLSPGGVIYVSIDDNELHNLLLLMGEVFGNENRAGVMTWVKKKKGSHLSRALRCITEYVLVFARDVKMLDLYGEDAYAYKWQPLLKRINREKILSFGPGVVETTLKKEHYPPPAYMGGVARGWSSWTG